MSTLFCLSIGRLLLRSMLFHINYILDKIKTRKQQLLLLCTFINEEITVSASDVLLVSAATCFSLVSKLPSGLYTKYHVEEFNIQWFLKIKVLVLFSHVSYIEWLLFSIVRFHVYAIKCFSRYHK